MLGSVKSMLGFGDELRLLRRPRLPILRFRLLDMAAAALLVRAPGPWAGWADVKLVWASLA